MRLFLNAVMLLCAVGAGSSSLAAEWGRGIEVRDYKGWRASVYMNATETPIQVVIVPAIGGRMIHFSVNGENILFENSATLGKTLASSMAESQSAAYLDPAHSRPSISSLAPWYGGYQAQLGPLLRNLPEDAEFHSSPQPWKSPGDFAVTVSPTNSGSFGVVVEKKFVLAPDTGELGIIQRLKNTSDTERSYSLYDRTACKNGGFVIVPLKKNSRFPKGWSYWYTYENKWVCDDVPPMVPQAHVLDGVLVLEARGPLTTIQADSDAGWIAYVKGKVLFVKYFRYDPSGNYSDTGNTVRVSYDQQTMEFGPVSPEFKLTPGAEASFPEQWSLSELKNEVTTAEQARKLVKKIKRSPFK